jgi:hypothetical protein
MMVEGHEVRCGACGEISTVFVDPSGGHVQSYVEDCQVCCRPSRIEISIDPDSGEATVSASYEG